MDVAHIHPFGKHGTVHVIIAAFSGSISISASAGKAVWCVHLFSAFAALGCHLNIKTNDGSSNTSFKFQSLFSTMTYFSYYMFSLSSSETNNCKTDSSQFKMSVTKIKKGGVYMHKSDHIKVSQNSFTLRFISANDKSMTTVEKHWLSTAPKLLIFSLLDRIITYKTGCVCFHS